MEILIEILLMIIYISVLVIFLNGLSYFRTPYSCRDNRYDGKMGFLTGVAGMTLLMFMAYEMII